MGVEDGWLTNLHALDIAQDISLSQWLALTPPDLVKAHLDISDETIQHLSKVKPTVVAPYYPVQG